MFSVRAKIFLIVIATLCTTSFGTYPISRDGCSDKCGDLTIPYPFGTTSGCHYPHRGFFLICLETRNEPARAFLIGQHQRFQVISISLETGEMKAYKQVDWRCYSSQDVSKESNEAIRLPNPYMFSFKKNKFTAIGCDSLAFVWGRNSNYSYASGCVSYCGSSTDSAKDGVCEGAGCCQTPVPRELNNYNFLWGRHINVFYQENPCIYALIVEKKWYNFSTNDLKGDIFLQKVKGRVPVVLDWAIRDDTCMPAPAKLPEACLSDNSHCYNVTNGAGYLCACSKGYEGNPYLKHGCRDINECDDENKEKYICHGICTNTMGGYKCECEKGKHGDPNLTKCTDIFPTAARVIVGISGAIVIIIAVIFVVVIFLQRKMYEMERNENYWRNGGQALEELLKTRVQTIEVFTEEQLKKMTNNFDHEQIIGSGGHGNVYRGSFYQKIRNNLVRIEVAIKRSKEYGEAQKEEFANEIITLSQINHINVVRLIGCCLEVKTPMLVYQYIPNGTLFHFLHGRNRRSIPLGMRLRIAEESAEALSTLHYSMNYRILHGDVKSLNILLDNEFRAKVSDFGASSLVPLEGDQLVKFVQGTVGYLDPQCFITKELTEKSDVHSFGVVILELITRKQVIYTDENGHRRSLALAFTTAMEENRLESILDKDIVNERTTSMLREVADLALNCLNTMREDRPTMKEVAESLQALINSNRDLLVLKFTDHVEGTACIFHEGGSDDTTESDALLSSISPLQFEAIH